ncbi:MAG: hypothetical protein KAZ18_07765 [Acinetobacter sp.]|nr:hypothetical protein [Acinetobacter sp.]
MNTAQQNERIDARVLEVLRSESPLTLDEISKNTGIAIDDIQSSVERLQRQNYAEPCPPGYILTEFAEDVCFAREV